VSSQQLARNALRSAWPGLIEASLLSALTAAQAEAAAEAVIAGVWPSMRIEDMIRLDRAEESFLLRGAVHPDCLIDFLEKELEQRAEDALSVTCPGNRHARGRDLRQLLRAELQTRATVIGDMVYKLFEAQRRDRFCSPSEVRESVIRRLSDLILDELKSLGSSDEADVKRKLKILTAITTLGGHAAQRAARLGQIQTGNTAEFPYVPKYLNRGEGPSVQSFPVGLKITLSGFRAPLLDRFPEAQHVRACLERYHARTGAIARFIDADGPVAPGLEGLYTSKPPFMQSPTSDLLLP
jgi:hypothetical protein